MEQHIQKRVNEWLSESYDSKTRNTIQELIDTNNTEELVDRFYKDLEFGTGGLRGVVGAGTNRMNIYNVRKTTQGLANCIKQFGEASREKSVVITYDCRHFSTEFAREAAQVLAGNGIKAYLTDGLRPTPFLSYAIRKLNAQAGIVITASHNPPQYNGYKVSWSDGGQVVPPIDKAIIAEVRAISDLKMVKHMDLSEAEQKNLITYTTAELEDQYLEKCMEQVIDKEIIREYAEQINIVYTPLHGTGITLFPKLMEKMGIHNFHPVPEQSVPDGDFPTVAYPNPEEPEAMAMAIELAKKKMADLIIATDPDADRVGIGFRSKEGKYILPNGNQILSMLTHYKLSKCKEQNQSLNDCFVVKTIVTTDLMNAIAEDFDIEIFSVLTGFKWIANQIKVQEGKKKYLIGGEESFGYLAGDHCRDKDSVGIAALLCEMACSLKKEGITFEDYLNRMYLQYGFYTEGLRSITLAGQEGEARIKGLIQKMKEAPVSELQQAKLVKIMDVEQSIEKNYPENTIINELSLPKSPVIGFYYADGSRVMLRPSGTEPKIKFYFGTRVIATQPDETIEEIRKKGGEKLNSMIGEFMDIVENLI